MKSFLNKQDELTRRSFMTWAARTFLGVSVSPLLGGHSVFGSEKLSGGTAEHVIYLYLAGGMSHLDTLDPKPGTEEQGPTEVIKTSLTGERLTANVPELAKRLNKVALIRSIKSTQGAHEMGNHFMHTGYIKRGTIVHPSMGAWTSAMRGRLNPTLPPHVLVSGGSQHPGAGFLDAAHAPVPIGDPEGGLQNSERPKRVSEDQMKRRLRLLDQFDRDFHADYPSRQVKAYGDLYTEALNLMKSEDLAAFDVSQETQAMRDRYCPVPGFTDATGGALERQKDFGLGCLLARRLVEHGVRFVEVNLGGWDTHTDNFERVPEQAHILDRALSALMDDLEQRGMLEKTLVVVATEFGRSPKLNDTDGRNHHPQAFSGLLAGGGIQGGQIYGKTDEIGKEVIENPVTVPDFNATIAYAQGLPLDKIVYSPSGRPFTVADKGKPVTALF